MSRCHFATESLTIIGAHNALTIPPQALKRRCLMPDGHTGLHLMQRHDQTFVTCLTELFYEEVSVEVANQYLFGREGG